MISSRPRRLPEARAQCSVFHAFVLGGAAVLFALPRPSEGQQLGPGAMPIGVQMLFDNDAYAIAGSTAREILDQMRALGPPSGWTRFPYAYRWEYNNERVPLTNGEPSDHCRPIDFEMTLEVTATYPRWTAPKDASEELVAAWADFSSQLERRWEQFRDDLVGRAREAATRIRRFEELCVLINRRIRPMVIEAFGQPDPRTADEPRVRLQWPPEGYAHLLRPPSAPAPEGEPGTPEDPESAQPVTARLAPGPAVTPAVGIDAAVRLDLARGGAIGIVVDLHHLGELQFREAFGVARPGSDDPLEPEAPFAFPAFTEVLIATLASSLADQGVLDLHSPVADHLPELSPRLGATTLHQLLSHRAGLDNTIVPNTADWSVVMDRLDDRALFTEPGAVFSFSRYSYPLAARVIESATDIPVEDAIARSVLNPLGLRQTSIGPREADDARDGLPVTHTTVEEMTRFWTSWLSGDIAGVGPDFLDTVTTHVPEADGRTFFRGYWQDRVGTAPRISLMCGSSRTGYASGFQVYPNTQTIMVFWGRYGEDDRQGARAPPSPDRWPKESVRFVLSRVADALQMGDEVYRPTLLTGGSQPGGSAQRCAEPAVSERRLDDFGPRAPAGDWVGRYVNGEWFFQLQEREGFLVSPVDPTRTSYSVRHYGGDVYFTDMDLPGGPSIGFPIRLIRDDSGRRYVMLGDRAYLHEDDRPER